MASLWESSAYNLRGMSGSSPDATFQATPDMLSSVGGGGGGGGGGDTDWMASLFGNKEMAGAVPVATQALSGVVQGWLGYEQLKLSKENTALAKEQFQQSKEMTSMEAALKLDARKRGLAKHGITSEAVDKYAAKYQ